MNETPPGPPLEVHEQGERLTITHRWFTFAHVVLAVVCVAWLLFLGFVYAMVAQPEVPRALLLLPLLHLVAGVALTYVTLAGFVNRTVIAIDRGHLTVRHGPLPWPGSVDLPASTIDQLFPTEKITHTRSGTHVMYRVRAALKDGREITIASGLRAPAQALVIEQALERHLGIPDRPGAAANGADQRRDA